MPMEKTDMGLNLFLPVKMNALTTKNGGIFGVISILVLKILLLFVISVRVCLYL